MVLDMMPQRQDLRQRKAKGRGKRTTVVITQNLVLVLRARPRNLDSLRRKLRVLERRLQKVQEGARESRKFHHQLLMLIHLDLFSVLLSRDGGMGIWHGVMG